MGREVGEAGQHPHVGALDVVPIVYLDLAARGAAAAAALVVADRIGEELQIPVFLYGELSASERAGGRTRAELRRGGIALLAQRIAADSQRTARSSGTAAVAGGLEPVRPDFGPARLHPTAGATLVAARPPLVAFNLQLAAPATIADARTVASLVREGGPEGLPGLRAIGVALGGDVSQVSMNIERPLEVSLATVIEAVSRHARVESAELVGLAPRAALEGFPEDLPIVGFDPSRHVIENAIGW
jgi:glutamate formiminotransferase/glutamate formiminotransferase/formiminotetrahydrofolate cyclodeaminase